MRLGVLVPPVLAIIVSLIILPKDGNLRKLRAENENLRGQVAAKDSDRVGTLATRRPIRLTNLSGWEDFVGTFSIPIHGVDFDGLAVAELERVLAAMSEKEIIAALHEISNLDESNGRKNLERLVLTHLGLRDPATLCREFAHRVKEQYVAFDEPLEKWLAEDRELATAWLDQLIERGIFKTRDLGGIHYGWIFLEGVVLRALAADQPEIIIARLEKLSADRRGRVLFSSESQDSQLQNGAAYARIIRAALRPNERGHYLSEPTTRVRNHRQLEGFNSYLDAIEATDSQRLQMSKNVLFHLFNSTNHLAGTDQDTFNGAYRWFQQSWPDQTPEILGKKLAGSWDAPSTIKTRTQIVRLHFEEFGDEKLVLAFINGDHPTDYREVRELANLISDEELRNRLFEK